VKRIAVLLLSLVALTSAAALAVACDDETPGTSASPAASSAAQGAVFAETGAPEAPAKGVADATQQTPASRSLEAPIWDFGFDLLARQAARTDGNVLVSPASLHAVLCMTLNGAQGETAAEMRRALAIEGVDPQTVNQGWADLIAAAGADEGAEVRIADSLWLRDGVHFKPAFLTADRDYFAADARALPSDLATSVKEINTWVERRTGGRIENLFQQLDPATVAVLVNTVYVKAGWIGQSFDRKDTGPAPFTLSGSEQVEVPTMHATFAGPAATTTAFNAVELQACGEVGVWIVVPRGEQTPEAVLTSLRAAGPTALWKASRNTNVDLALPRFHVEYGAASLPSDLQTMGMRRAFVAGQADFGGMADGPLWVGDVVQKTVLDVNEEGVEAAAGSGLVAKGGWPQGHIEIRADRPFLVVLTALRRTQAPLFLAVVRDPR